MPPDALLIANPRMGEERMAELRAALRVLRARGTRVRARVTFESRDARRFARRAADGGIRLVIAAGGDGTVHEVANGLARAERRPRLAVVPCGTANDFATAMGLPTEVEAALSVALNGVASPLDLGVVNGRYFVNVSIGGPAAAAGREVTPRAKKLLGRLVYAWAGMNRLRGLEPTRGRFRLDGVERYAGEFIGFAVGNTRRTGGGTMVTPAAEPDDGELDVLIVPDLSRMDLLRLLPELRAGRHLHNRDIVYDRARSIEVDAAESVPVNVDGEPLRARRFDYRIAGRCLSIMLPR